MALSAERGPYALGRNVPAPPRRHPLGRLRPRLWGAGPTVALVILQAVVFAASGCLLAPFDISHPGRASTWAFALPSSPVPPAVELALPHGPSRSDQVRARVVLPVATTPGSGSTRTPPSVPSVSAAPRKTDIIEPVVYAVLPAVLTPRRPVPAAGPAAPHVPVAGVAAPHVPVAGRKAHRKADHRHLADHRARDHKHRGTLLARRSLTPARHGSATPHVATHGEAC